jgi:hypothetical protein
VSACPKNYKNSSIINNNTYDCIPNDCDERVPFGIRWCSLEEDFMSEKTNICYYYKNDNLLLEKCQSSCSTNQLMVYFFFFLFFHFKYYLIFFMCRREKMSGMNVKI